MLLCFLLVQKLQNLSEDTTDSAILPQQSRDSFAIADFYPSNFLLIQQENGLPRFLSGTDWCKHALRHIQTHSQCFARSHRIGKVAAELQRHSPPAAAGAFS